MAEFFFFSVRDLIVPGSSLYFSPVGKFICCLPESVPDLEGLPGGAWGGLGDSDCLS